MSKYYMVTFNFSPECSARRPEPVWRRRRCLAVRTITRRRSNSPNIFLTRFPVMINVSNEV